MIFLSWFARQCLRLRYKVTIEGEELLKKYKDASTLFLANHPALIDPVIVLSYLEPYVKIKPLAAKKFFHIPFIHYFLQKLDAAAVPEFETGNNEYKAYQVEKLTKEIEVKLRHKAKILLYPAGHLSDSAREKLGGAAMAYDLRFAPSKIIGIATDGLYGSLFSRYWNGKTPSFFDVLIQGIKIIVLNGIFFAPKRTVSIRIFEFDEDLKTLQDKSKFNATIESKFASLLNPKETLVSYGFYKMPQKVFKTEHKNHRIDDEIKNELLKIAQKVLKRPVNVDSHLSYDLGMDSLELAEILAMVEQKFRVRIDHFPETLLELGSLIQLEGQFEPPKIVHSKERHAAPIQIPEGSLHILHAFYQQIQLDPKRRLGQDQSLGEITYKKAFLIVELIAKQLKTHHEKYIGIALPSSIMAYLLMLACLRAKKVPVLLNWTGGFASCDFAINLLGLQSILSSEKFLEKAFNIDLRQHFEKIWLLEELKQKISVKDKLKAYVSTFFCKQAVIKVRSFFHEDNQAIILFTSGSESMPKAVPLTHKNILSNIEGLLATQLVHDKDRFLATLPPFHSFGCVVSGFLPMITGLDTIYMPDPTDAPSIASAIGLSKATLFCSAPSFLKQILVYGLKEDLASLRLVVVGAEKLQDAVRVLFKEKCPFALLLEGYGITECSPVVTIQRNAFTKGVGIPLKNVKLLIADPLSLTPLEKNHVGEILISGPSVFSGYLGLKKDPFVEIDDQRWYRSGDRGLLTEKHELVLEGRFKRFVKISAEMISLGSIEEAIEDLRQAPDGVAQFAVVANKAGDGMILFTIHDNLHLDEVNQHLRLKGCPKVAKIAKIISKSSIPQLATGKIDYRSLDHETL